MAFCIPKLIKNDFIEKLKKGEINFDELANMDNAGRQKFFENFMGREVGKRSEERRVGKECRSRWSP